MERILVLAPHADDAEFGLGGTLHRLAHPPEGTAAPQIRVVIFAWGDYMTKFGGRVSGNDRRVETQAAMMLLGIDNIGFMYAYRENEADQAGFSNVVSIVEREIRAFRPDTLFTCLPSFNQDHEVLHKATVTALRPGRFDRLKSVFNFEYPGNFWAQPLPGWGHVFSQISEEDLDRKVEALQAHRSQFSSVDPVLVSPEGARNLALLRGLQCGARQAELFYLLRGIL